MNESRLNCVSHVFYKNGVLSFRTWGKTQSDLYRDKQENTATCGTITVLKRVVMGTFKKIMGSDRNMSNYVFLASDIFKNCHEAQIIEC